MGKYGVRDVRTTLTATRIKNLSRRRPNRGSVLLNATQVLEQRSLVSTNTLARSIERVTCEHQPAIIAKSYLDFFRVGYINSTHGFKLNRQFLFILPSTRRFNKPSDFPPCSINPGRDCPTICSRFSSVFLPYSVCDLLPSFRESFLSRGNSSPLFLNTNCGSSTAKRSEKTRISLNACLR